MNSYRGIAFSHWERARENSLTHSWYQLFCSINQLDIYDHTIKPMTSSLSMSKVLYLRSRRITGTSLSVRHYHKAPRLRDTCATGVIDGSLW